MFIDLCLWLALFVYSILDYFQTIELIKFGYEEANPIVLWIVKDNWSNLLYVKVIMMISLGILLIERRRRNNV